jgi:tRNA 2-thiouridine synthesizing protein A
MAIKFEKISDGTYLLDVQGYVCPHPQIYTKKALQKLKSGEVLELVFDNPSSGESVAAMCESEGDEIVDRSQAAGDPTLRWRIRKG